MAYVKLYWYNGSSWVKVSDSSDYTGSPIAFGTILAGSNSSAQRLQLRTDTGYQSISISPYDNIRVTPSGAHSTWFQLTRDNGGAPSGTWLAGGTQYVVSSGQEIEPDNAHDLWVRVAVPSSAQSAENIADTRLQVLTWLTTDFAVSSTSPITGQVAPSSASFNIVFNKNVSSASVAGKFVLRRRSNSSAVATSVTLSGDGRTVIVNPTISDLPDDNYDLTITRTLVDTEGCELSETSDVTLSWAVMLANDPPMYSVAKVGSASATAFVVSGTHVSGKAASDTISSIKVAWTKPGESPGAVGSTQYRILTGAALTSYSGAGYTLTGITGFEGFTWTPWAQTTETTSGGVQQTGNWVSGTAFATSDLTAPSQVLGLYLLASGATSLTYGWQAGADNIGVTAYDRYHSTGAAAPTSATTPTATGITATSAQVTGLTENTSYYLYTRARDAAGNIGLWSVAITGRTMEAEVVIDWTGGVVTNQGVGSVGSIANIYGNGSVHKLSDNTLIFPLTRGTPPSRDIGIGLSTDGGSTFSVISGVAAQWRATNHPSSVDCACMGAAMSAPSTFNIIFASKLDGTNWSIVYVQGQASSTGVSWSTPEVVFSGSVGNSYEAGLVVDSSGYPHVVCSSIPGGTNGKIYHSYRTSSSADWVSNRVLTVNDANNKQRPCVAIDPADNIHLMYLDLTTSRPMYTRTYGGSWQTAVVLESDRAVGAIGGLNIDICGDYVHAVFSAPDPVETKVFYVRSANPATGAAAPFASNPALTTVIATTGVGGYGNNYPFISHNKENTLYLGWLAYLAGEANNNVWGVKATLSGVGAWTSFGSIRKLSYTTASSGMTFPALFPKKVSNSFTDDIPTQGTWFTWRDGASANPEIILSEVDTVTY